MSGISDLRREYSQKQLLETEAAQNPLSQFRVWFDEALKAEITEPNAFTLSTSDSHNKPSSRVLLLKGITDAGFEFFTNYNSRKGGEILHNPQVAMNFCWLDIERQIRVEGVAEKLTAERSDEYFYTRPRGSQIGAVASTQSQPLPNREVLEDHVKSLETFYAEHPLTRPEHWGGYLVKPTMIEFWQGRPSRLHDRLQYTLSANGEWRITRLYP